MNKPVKVLLFYLSLIVLLTNCRDKAMEEYYGRPEWLEPPMYQQLDSMGNFKNFLALVDKAEYKRTLSGSGFWTLFAPNDAAFEAYFQEKGITGISEIDSATARGLVTYSLVYNAYTVEQLSNYQSMAGPEEANAFRRRTAYDDGVYKEVTIDENGNRLELNAVAANRNGGYVLGDNGKKYIPYFTSEYFSSKGLSAADYNYFYPTGTHTSFNVAGASVVKGNLPAENGFFNEIDKVIEPLKNIDQQMASNPQYEYFRNLYEKHLVLYLTHPELTKRFQVLTGNTEPVYTKIYDPGLPYSPNNENYGRENSGYYENEGQTGAYSIFVPTNEAAKAYVEEVLLEHYETMDRLPVPVIRDFLTAHMWDYPVWPTKFANSSHQSFGEEPGFDPEGDIIEKKVLSNGFFYGVDKVQRSNVFHSVYGKMYLNPNYSEMIRALGQVARETLSASSIQYVLFLLSNEALAEAGFTYDSRQEHWVYSPPGGGAELTGSPAKLRLDRLINQHVVLVSGNSRMEHGGDLSDLGGSGIIKTKGGEYIKFSNNQLFSAGNADREETVAIDTEKGAISATNGIVYYVDRALEVSDKKIPTHIEEYIKENSADSIFWKFAATQIEDNGDFEGTSSGAAHTIFIPTDAAMRDAIAAGLLPGTPEEPNYAPSDPIERAKVTRFVKYHILASDILVNTEQHFSLNYNTVYKDLEGVTKTVTVFADGGTGLMRISDLEGRSATVVPAHSNILSNGAVIHQIDNYLDYGYESPE